MKRKLIVFALCVNLLQAFEIQAQKRRVKREETPVHQQMDDRKYWSDLLYRIALPVVRELSKGDLRKNMPMEVNSHYYLKVGAVTHLEAVGRTSAGIAPWLALPDDSTQESVRRKEIREYLLKGLAQAVDPKSGDLLNFATEQQPLVDAAFLAHAFLRAPKQLWEPLDSLTKKRYILAFQSLRNRKAGYNNWLLFSAMTEAFLLSIGESYDPVRIDYAIHKMNEWYVGDGWYMDGEHFAMDYYSSYVMHPMLTDILKLLVSKKMVPVSQYETAVKRMVRYAEFQERLVSPEGTYPPLGRSIAYRIGAFQVLAQVSLNRQLPVALKPGQVRAALTAVLHRQFEAAGTFNDKGWLQLGFAGHQLEFADPYISTGSLYLCTFGFLPLGLPADAPFWTDAAEDWTGKKAWSGKDFNKDQKID